MEAWARDRGRGLKRVPSSVFLVIRLNIDAFRLQAMGLRLGMARTDRSKHPSFLTYDLHLNRIRIDEIELESLEAKQARGSMAALFHD